MQKLIVFHGHLALKIILNIGKCLCKEGRISHNHSGTELKKSLALQNKYQVTDLS